ncbi:MAG: hypothetical protein DRP64_02990 [Verrucomicrobia bacterium]|nr:MAG: hypothetical protein DRP64_02990 [Verrucomicrobiota bacterium]
MKKTALLFLASGLIGGFAIGHASKSTPKSTIPEPKQSVEPKPAHPARPREQELLLQAIQELDLTTAELEDAIQYIKKLERNTQRYNWLMGYWKEKGFGTSYQMKFGNYMDFSLTPSTDLVEFFGWNEEQVSQMAKIGRETVASIKHWESSHAVLVEESEDKKVYDIQPSPDEVTDLYLRSMETIVGSEDMELLSSKLEKQFAGIDQTRTVTLEIVPSPAQMNFSSDPDPDAKSLKILVQVRNDPFWLNTGTSAMFMPYTPGETISERWNHVFQMEGKPTPIPDDTQIINN